MSVQNVGEAAVPLIAVASRSFSASEELRSTLLASFPRCRFNSEGLRLDGDSLVEFLSDAEGIIVGVEPLNSGVLERLPQLKVVSKYGIGLDSIDLDAVDRLGITLARETGTNSAAVAELALFLMLGVLRRVPEALDSVAARKWEGVSGRLLEGKTVGLVGVGNVARRLVPLLQPFGCTVLGFDEQPSDLPYLEMVSLDLLLAESDVVSLHLPLVEQTSGFMSRQRLALMKPTAVLINTSRGGVVDQEALLEALTSSRIAGAGLDVLAEEPPQDWKLATLPTVLLTPHLGGSSQESNRAMGMAAIDGLVRNRDRLVGPH